MVELSIFSSFQTIKKNEDAAKENAGSNAAPLPEVEMGAVYTAGLHDQGFPELLVQDVPKDSYTAIYSVFTRLIRRLKTGQRLYTDSRIVEDSGHCFRLIEVTHEGYRMNLIDHVMVNWHKGRSNVTEEFLRKVNLFVLVPWFRENMERWGTLPRPPKGRYDRRDKIFWTAMSLDCRGRKVCRSSLSSSSSSSCSWPIADDEGFAPEQDGDNFDEEDAAYFLKYKAYFLHLLDLPSAEAVLYRMPGSFQQHVLAMGERMMNDAARRLSRASASSQASWGGDASRNYEQSPSNMLVNNRQRCPGSRRRGGFRLSGGGMGVTAASSPATSDYTYYV